MLLETAANLCASRGKANDFFTVFSSFELGGITKHLMTGPTRNSEFCFPLTGSMFSSGNTGGLRETQLTVSLRASHEVLIVIII